jgi:hypothetical protein
LLCCSSRNAFGSRGTLLAPCAADVLAETVGTSYLQGAQPESEAVANAFNPDQPLDEKGRFASGAGGSNVERSNEDNDARRTAQSPLESAKSYVGRGAETSPGHDSPDTERLARLATERERLTQRGRENNRVLASVPESQSGGKEGRLTQWSRENIRLIPSAARSGPIFQMQHEKTAGSPFAVLSLSGQTTSGPASQGKSNSGRKTVNPGSPSSPTNLPPPAPPDTARFFIARAGFDFAVAGWQTQKCARRFGRVRDASERSRTIPWRIQILQDEQPPLQIPKVLPLLAPSER